MKKTIAVFLALLIVFMSLPLAVLVEAVETGVAAESNSDYMIEDLAGKTDLIAGLEATYNCPKESNNGLKTDLLTDGIIGVKSAPVGETEEKYFNKAYGSADDVAAIEFAGVDTKALYSFSFEGLGGAKVTGFQAVYAAQDGKKGRIYNTAHADVQLMFLVSSDNGATWTKAFISTFVEGKNVVTDEATGVKITMGHVDDSSNYYLVDVTLDNAYENVTDVVLASPLGRSQVNGWAGRIIEFNVFGEKAAGTFDEGTSEPDLSLGWEEDYSAVAPEYIQSGTPVNSLSFASNVNPIRRHWTPGRQSNENTGIYNPDCKYVKDGDDAVLQIVGNQYFSLDETIEEGQYIGISMKLVEADGFLGGYMNFDIEATPAIENSITVDDRLMTPVAAVNGGEGVEYCLNSGMGYSIVKQDRTKHPWKSLRGNSRHCVREIGA